MSFLKDHLAPILHNALGGIITATVLTSGGLVITFVKPVRDVALSIAIFSLPLWIVLITLFICTLPLLIHIQKLRAQLAAMEQRLMELESHLTEAQKKQQVRDAAEKNRIPPKQRRNWVMGWRDGI